MSQAMGMAEFFAMEASEYLDRLDVMISAPKPPDHDELLRLARALRGSALMANQQSIAMVAAGVENLARAVRERRRPWDEGTRQIAISAVDGLKILVRRIADWNSADDARARDLAGELERASGRATAPARGAGAGGGLDAGTRSFIAREGSSLASALDQTAKALQQNPRGRDPVQAVLKVMKPLRGLASVSDLPPMPDLLEGVERAVNEVLRRKEPLEEAGAVFDAAARALSRAAREVAAMGKTDAESPETIAFTTLLARALGLDGGVVAIESLYFQDAGPHIVHRGDAGVTAADSLELVSHGEHLKQIADALASAETATQRQLRALALAGTIRALASIAGDPLADAATAFAATARDMVTSGGAVRRTAEFARLLRDAGAILSNAAIDDHNSLGPKLRAVTVSIRALITSPAPAEAPPVAAAAPPVPAPAAAPRQPAAAQPQETPDLAGSFLRFHRYLETLGSSPAASIDELLAGPPVTPAAAPPSRPVPEDAIPIESLQYAGDSALERALSLRENVRQALANRAADGRHLAELIEEVFDLVRLGLRRT